ncbi:sugar phosphate isomerase/epimerase [Streptantibioticus parmotrematis]|uniref:sugar phosphate isomerase/epimerase family protein n=1 Tax=Streptantibioticus parmotrematis TaxID=2873249 RepID=UPI0033CC8022
MKLALITDEVGQDVEEAIRLGLDFGIRHFAIRSAWGLNVAEFEDAHLERLEALLETYDVGVSSVLSPLFKCHLPSGPDRPHHDPHFVGFSRDPRDHLDRVGALAATAGRLRAPVLRLFSFLLPDLPGLPGLPDGVSAPGRLPEAAYAELARIPGAMPPGTVAAMENEHVCHIRTLPELQDFLGERGEGFGAALDLSNHHLAGGPVDPTAMTPQLVARAVDLHVKDRRDGRYVPVGQGTFDWSGILRRVRGLGYDGFVTLESHLRGDEEGVRASLTALRKVVTA